VALSGRVRRTVQFRADLPTLADPIGLLWQTLIRLICHGKLSPEGASLDIAGRELHTVSSNEPTVPNPPAVPFRIDHNEVAGRK